MTSLTSSEKRPAGFSARAVIQVLIATFALLLATLPALSQLNLGRIYGAVSDQSGAVVPGVMVTVTDVARGVSRSLTTDNAGDYSAPSLVPGTYNIRAEAN